MDYLSCADVVSDESNVKKNDKLIIDYRDAHYIDE